MSGPQEYEGGCHCGAVRYRISVATPIDVLACNCSICAATGFLHVIVERGDFLLLRGAEFLTTYRFNTRSAAHKFCRRCGIKSFYHPRSHPDGISVSLRCLDTYPDLPFEIREFDGRNWEASIDSIT